MTESKTRKYKKSPPLPSWLVLTQTQKEAEKELRNLLKTVRQTLIDKNAVANTQIALTDAAEEADRMFRRVVDIVTNALVEYVPSLDPFQGGLLPTDIAVDKSMDFHWYIEKEGFIRAGFQEKLIQLKKKLRLSNVYMRNAVREAVHRLEYIRREVVKEERMAENAATAIAKLRGVERTIPVHLTEDKKQEKAKSAVTKKHFTSFRPLQLPTLKARPRLTGRSRRA